MMLNRNDLCWCKSGFKYKKCHLEFDERLDNLKRKGNIVPTRNLIRFWHLEWYLQLSL